MSGPVCPTNLQLMTDSEPDGKHHRLAERPSSEPTALQSIGDSTAAVADRQPPQEASQLASASIADQKMPQADQPPDTPSDQYQSRLPPGTADAPSDSTPNSTNISAAGPTISDVSSTPTSSGTAIVTPNSLSTSTSDATVSDYSATSAPKEFTSSTEQSKYNAPLAQISEDSPGMSTSQLVRAGPSLPASHVQFSHTPFIQKLYAMLEDPHMEHVIIWSSSGDSFLVNPSNEFSQLLCLYFKHTNISSFVRQLSMYGFHKVAHSHGSAHNLSSKNADFPWEFRHCDGAFRRGDIEALRTIKRRTSRHSNPSKRQKLVAKADNTGFAPQMNHAGQEPAGMHPMQSPHAPHAPQGHPQPQALAQPQPQPQQQIPLLPGPSQGQGEGLFSKVAYRHPGVTQHIGQWPMVPGTPSIHSSMSSSLNTNSLRSTPVSSHFNSISSLPSSVSHPGSQLGHPSMVGTMQNYVNVDHHGNDNALDYLMQAQQSLQLQILELSRAVSDVRSAMEHIRWSEVNKSVKPKPVSPDVTPTESVEPGFMGPNVPSPSIGAVAEDDVNSPRSVGYDNVVADDPLVDAAEEGLAAGSESQDRIKLKSLLN